KLAAELGTYDAVEKIIGEHLALSAELSRAGVPGVVIWPEMVYPTTFGAPKSEEGAFFDRRIASFALASNAPLVFGAAAASADGEHNAAFFLSPGGAPVTYEKSLLFPVAERLPGWLDWDWLRRAFPWTGALRRGRGARAVPLRLASGEEVRFAPLICYEAIDT